MLDVHTEPIALQLQLRSAALALMLATGLVAAGGAQERYRDPSVPVAERVSDLIGRMTVEEKFWQLYMIPGALSDGDYSKGIFGLQNRAAPSARADAELHNTMQRYFASTRLGIPMLNFEEGVHGVMRHGATVFPQAIALAATWDSSLVGQVSEAIAREMRTRGLRQVLSPVVNIASDVRWGRVEETYGEDPHLSSVMGRAFVRAFERRGVIATPKHFVANVGEGGRDSYPIDLSQRFLEEIHYPPFRATINDAGARSVMTSYNSVDGSPATQNRALLNGKLKGDWRFSGFVISDQAATGGATVLHYTEPNTAQATRHALESGLDVIFQSSYAQHRTYLDAFTRGLIADSVIDAAVSRVLRAKFELGLFEDAQANPDSAAHWNRHASHTALAREAARASLVLLRNERNRLPLRGVRSVAVIGTDAIEARLGGYTMDSAPGVSIVEGLRARLGRAAVRYEPGPGRGEPQLSPVIPSAARNLQLVPSTAFDSLRGEYWDNNRLDGPPRVTRSDANIDFRWTLSSPARGIPFDWYSARWTGKLKVPASGARRVAVEGNDGYRLWVDNRLVIDNWRKVSFGRREAAIVLAPSATHTIRLEYFESTGNARLRLLWDAGAADNSEQRIVAAVAAARATDVAVVVAGIEEGEFRDRASLALPGRQEELITRVAATGKPVVVVLVGGSAITMSRWLDKVDAVLFAWYPGEQGGHAITDVLFGDYNPAGRLPVTFPVSEGQLPLYYNHKPTGRGDDYVDLTGMPLFPFGYGLSYTKFEYSGLALDPAETRATGSTRVRFRVKNTGTVAGDEVAQLYIRDVVASVARPIQELKGFTRVRLQPGEEREVVFALDARDLQVLDEQMRWIVEPGAYRVMVGASSKDIRLRGELLVRP